MIKLHNKIKKNPKYIFSDNAIIIIIIIIINNLLKSIVKEVMLFPLHVCNLKMLLIYRLVLVKVALCTTEDKWYVKN